MVEIWFKYAWDMVWTWLMWLRVAPVPLAVQILEVTKLGTFVGMFGYSP